MSLWAQLFFPLLDGYIWGSDNRIYNDRIQKLNHIFNFKLSFFKVNSRWISCGQSPSITHIKNLIPSRSTRCSVMLAHSPLVEGIAEKFWSINLAKHLGSECRWTQQAHRPDTLHPSLHHPPCHHFHRSPIFVLALWFN